MTKDVSEILTAVLKNIPSWVGYSHDPGAPDKLRVYVDMPAGASNIAFAESQESTGFPGIADPLQSVEIVQLAPLFTPTAQDLADQEQELRAGARIQSRATVNGARLTSDFGSIGAFLRNESTWLLTANHVIFSNGRFHNFADSTDDGVYAGNPPRRVSRIVHGVAIKRPDTRDTAGSANLVDAAISQISDDLLPSSPLYPEVGQVTDGTPVIPRPQRDAAVTMLGQGGRVSNGTVVDPGGTFRITVNVQDVETATFADQILISGNGDDFARRGDSGSMVFAVTDSGLRPIGIVIAKTEEGRVPRCCVVTPLEHVFAAFQPHIGNIDRIVV